jgi:hypothetical protein
MAWDIEGLLTDDTGKLISNALKTAVPPPRQDESDADGLLPRASGRNAEALHQMADGGATSAANLILLCRFHHGRIHTDKWTIRKTGPGTAEIRHRRTGFSDAEWEADPDLPNGHDSSEWSPTYRRQLTDYADWFAQKSMEASIAKSRERFREIDAANLEKIRVEEPVRAAKPATPVVLREDPGGPPFLTCPQRATAEGSAGQAQRSPIPKRTGPLSMSRGGNRPGKSALRTAAKPKWKRRTDDLFVAAAVTAPLHAAEPEVEAQEEETS